MSVFAGSAAGLLAQSQQHDVETSTAEACACSSCTQKQRDESKCFAVTSMGAFILTSSPRPSHARLFFQLEFCTILKMICVQAAEAGRTSQGVRLAKQHGMDAELLELALKVIT